MTSDETQIQIFANWPMSHAKRMTRDNGKIQNIMSLPRQGNCGQTQTVPQENHGQTKLKMSSISDLKRSTATKKTEQNDAKDRKTKMLPVYVGCVEDLTSQK